MEYSFTNDKPIYLQIVEQFIVRIASGDAQPGSKIDSVRDLALEAKVNPNTMQKAMAEMERLELVRTERNSGRYITEDLEKINGLKNQLAKTEIEAFLKKMTSIGFTKEEVIALISGNN